MLLDVYSGVKEVILTDEELAEFYRNKKDIGELLINQYLLIKDLNNKVVDKFKWNGKELAKFKIPTFKNTGILKPLDDIQLCAYDSLFNQEIIINCLTGKSGTGKTKTAISVGIELVKRGTYEKLILIRHAVETGESIGLLPGDKDQKLVNGWAGCFYDNLPGNKYEFEELMRTGKIEIESLSFLKGRDIKNSYVIFDEAEDANPDQIELAGSRINMNSKCVFVGDYNQTSKVKFKTNSGLLKLIDKAKGKDWFACIEMKENGRGIVAEFFATEFKE